MALAKRIESEDQVIAQPESIILPNSGSIAMPEGEVIVAEGPVQDDYAKQLAFDEELVEVTLAESTDPNADPFVETWVNGVSQAFWRGVPVQCKRKYLFGLAKAQMTDVSTQEFMNGNGERDVRINRRTAIKYPFSVVDPNPKGAAWLKSVMSQG